MWRGEAGDPVGGFLPEGGGVAGKSGDESDVVIGDAGCAEDLDFLSDDGGSVAATGAADLGLDEGLYTEADAVDAGIAPGAGFIGSDAAGGGFEGGFGPGAAGNCVEQRGEM